jgi:hypothetical protein
VIVRPLPGWEFGGRADDGDGVLFSKGSGSLAVSVSPAREEPADALTALLAGWRAEHGTVISTGDIEASQIRGPAPAARVPYSGNFAGINYAVGGRRHRGPGFAGHRRLRRVGRQGRLRAGRADVDRMIEQATIPVSVIRSAGGRQTSLYPAPDAGVLAVHRAQRPVQPASSG